MRPATPDAGFTLLEMIVVLAVLGLMTGLVVARGPQRSPTLDLRAAASEVAQSLRGARARAIATNRRVVFRMDVASHAFEVDGARPRSLPASLALSVVAVSSEVAAGRLAGIGFAPDGSSSGGRIDFAQGNRHVRVDVAWLTGRVTVSDVPVDAR